MCYVRYVHNVHKVLIRQTSFCHPVSQRAMSFVFMASHSMRWLPMKLIQCRFSSGQRVPLLVQTGNATPLPILVPFIYVQLKLRYRAYNTAAAHLRAIQAFRALVRTQPLWLTSRWHLQMSPTSLNDDLRAISSMFVPTTFVTAA